MRSHIRHRRRYVPAPNPAVVTKANYNKLRKVFHPDGEARVSQERKAELTAAFQIFNRLKFKVIGKD